MKPYRVFKKTMWPSRLVMWTYAYINWNDRWVQGGPHHTRLGAWIAARGVAKEAQRTKRLLAFIKEHEDA